MTSGDVADFFLLHTHVDGDPAKATIFLVDKDAPGVRLVRTPKYMHTFVFEHPIFAFEDVRVGDDRILGEIGRGFELTKDWFVEERLMIGARTVGAATRALELSLAFAKDRRQFGRPIVDFQAVEFMLADMAAELMAAKSMLYRVCWEAARGGADRKELHAMAAAVKLVCSETAGRVADKAVQIHGGRGYMREQPVERLWRELRVDRIWEGTSEIQRVVIGNELRKRGAGRYTGWPVDRDLEDVRTQRPRHDVEPGQQRVGQSRETEDETHEVAAAALPAARRHDRREDGHQAQDGGEGGELLVRAGRRPPSRPNSCRGAGSRAPRGRSTARH